MNNRFSSLRYITARVTQGSIVGPILFNIYIFDKPNTNHTYLLIFADIAIFTSAKTNNTIIIRIDNHALKIQTSVENG